MIVVDRSVKADKSLYAAHIGSDMVIEGERAGTEMNKLLPNGGKIIELSGPLVPVLPPAVQKVSARPSPKLSKLLPLRLVTSPVPKANR